MKTLSDVITHLDNQFEDIDRDNLNDLASLLSHPDTDAEEKRKVEEAVEKKKPKLSPSKKERLRKLLKEHGLGGES